MARRWTASKRGARAPQKRTLSGTDVGYTPRCDQSLACGALCGGTSAGPRSSPVYDSAIPVTSASSSVMPLLTNASTTSSAVPVGDRQVTVWPGHRNVCDARPPRCGHRREDALPIHVGSHVRRPATAQQ